MESKISRAEIDAIIRESLPVAALFACRVENLQAGRVSVVMPFQGAFVRPGGTIAGPAIMGLADFAMFVVVLSLIGRVELAVTTNLNINFLRKPRPVDLVADARALKLGKRLAVMEVTIHSAGEAEPVAHATGTYSIPPT